MNTQGNEIVVRFYHGSRRKWKYRSEQKELGGKFGGHVVIQIEDFAYGFRYQDIRHIHIFPSVNKKNCFFQKQRIEEWYDETIEKRQTNIYIPVNSEEQQILLNYFEENILEPSCDYSFFGERCASNTFMLLKKINKMKGGSYFVNAFYPGVFRRKLIKEAIRRGYRIEQFEGSSKRVWEGKILNLD